MVIQPTVEVNPVVNAPATEANRWWPDPSEQGLADAKVSSGVCTIQAADRAGIKLILLLILAQKRNP